MRKLIAVAVAVIAVAPCFAWEFPLNPDRFPSVGAHISNSYVSGDRVESVMPDFGGWRSTSSPERINTNAVGGDVRLPLHSSLTLTVSYDYLQSDWAFVRDGSIYRETKGLTGYNVGAGFRYYFNR